MISEYDEAFLEAAERILVYNTEENRRNLFRAFQDAENHEKRMQRERAELKAQLEEKDAEIAELKRKLQMAGE